MEIQIKMVSAASEVLSFKKRFPNAIHEDVFQHVSDHISTNRIGDEKIKMAMIAAAGRAFELANKNPGFNEKELLKQIVEEIPTILYNIQE